MYFVYYSDDYDEMGGKGFDEFRDKNSALKFIEERIELKKSNIESYVLIKGEELHLKVKEKIKYIDVE